MLQYLLAPQELLQRIMSSFKKAPSYDGAYLPDTKDANKELIAQFYRRLGFIYTELGSYRAAYACYKYSLNFEELDYTYDEMYYISSNYDIQFKSINEMDVFKEYDIVIYTRPSLDC